MLPQAYIAHQSSGRLRIRIPEKRGDSSYFSHVQNTLKNSRARIRVNVLTGSILVEDSLDLRKIPIKAREEGLFDCKPLSKNQEVSLSKMLQGPWIMRGLVGLGTLQLLRGQILAPTSTLFMEAFRLWNQKTPQA